MRSFLADRRGNYALMTAVAMVPLMGGLALAVDFAEMNRQKQAVANALDAAGIATARQAVSGATDERARRLREKFLRGQSRPGEAGRHAAHRHAAEQPERRRHSEACRASSTTSHYFFPVFAELAGTMPENGNTDISFTTNTEIRLKNTLEVALVLDNSGSMSQVRLRLRPEAHRPAQDRGQAARRHAGAAGQPHQAGRQAGAIFAGSLRRVRQCRAGKCRRVMDGRRGAVAGPPREFRLVDAQRRRTSAPRRSTASGTRRAPAGAKRRTRSSAALLALSRT